MAHGSLINRTAFIKGLFDKKGRIVPYAEVTRAWHLEKNPPKEVPSKPVYGWAVRSYKKANGGKKAAAARKTFLNDREARAYEKAVVTNGKEAAVKNPEVAVTPQEFKHAMQEVFKSATGQRVQTYTPKPPEVVSDPELLKPEVFSGQRVSMSKFETIRRWVAIEDALDELSEKVYDLEASGGGDGVGEPLTPIFEEVQNLRRRVGAKILQVQKD